MPAVAAPASPAAGGPVADLPPAPSVGHLLWHISPEIGPIALVATMVGLYLAGVHRLTARGDTWSPARTISWLGGCLIVAYALIGGVAWYDNVLFSAHAVQHMLLGTVAPVPLALGAPVTLALRTLPRRPRAALGWLLHCRLARIATFPLVGFTLFVVSLYGLYFTGLYQASLEHGWLHLLVHIHFLAVGCLFYWPVIGIDPIPGRLPYWGRLILLFVTFPVHALWALAMFTTTQVFAQGWYERVHRPWGSSLLNDQHTGAGIMWASGEMVGVVVFFILFVQWSRADAREAARVDRRLDRAERLAATDTADPPEDTASTDTAPSLEEREDAYNEWLASLARGTR